MQLLEKILNSINKSATFNPKKPTNNFNKELDICFGVDIAFIRPMGVTITSLAENNPDVLLKIHVFLSAIAPEQISRLELLTKQYRNIIINLYNVAQEKFSMLQTNARMSPAVYFRIVMPLVLGELDSILYLDSDVVCLNNLEEIITLDMQDKTVAAVLTFDPEGERFRKLELPHGVYFLSGIMKINIKKWNKEDISRKTLEVKQIKRLGTEDQDALNVALYGKVIYLPDKWNYQAYGKIPSDTIFLHYSGNLKPWRCTYENNLQSYYLKYEQLSPWRDMEMELPITYPEARIYTKLLLKRGKYLEAVKWFVKLVKMRHTAKKLKARLEQNRK